MKRVLIISAAFLIIIIVLLVLLLIGGNFIINQTINKVGPTVLKVPVKIDNIKLNIFTGYILLENLFVGNPAGFNTPSLLKLQKMELQIVPKSLLSDVLIIKKFVLLSPDITYEQGLQDNNFSALLKNISGEPPQKDRAEIKQSEPESNKEKKEKKVIIEKLLIDNPQINLSFTAAQGKTLPIKIATIELNDIGKAEGGLLAADVVKIVISTLMSNIKQAASGSAQLLQESVHVVTDKAKNILTNTTDKAVDTVKKIGNLLKSKTEGQK